MAQLLIRENLMTKDDSDSLVKVSRMGNPRSNRIIYKVVLTTEAAASQRAKYGAMLAIFMLLSDND